MKLGDIILQIRYVSGIYRDLVSATQIMETILYDPACINDLLTSQPPFIDICLYSSLCIG